MTKINASEVNEINENDFQEKRLLNIKRKKDEYNKKREEAHLKLKEDTEKRKFNNFDFDKKKEIKNSLKDEIMTKLFSKFNIENVLKECEDKKDIMSKLT